MFNAYTSLHVQWCIWLGKRRRMTLPPKKITLPCSRLKVPICIQHTAQRPRFSSISICDAPFSSYALFFWKSALNDPKRPWHVHCQKYQYATYTLRPNFVSFSLQDERLSVVHYLSVRRPTVRRNSDFAETFYGQVPVYHISRHFFFFFNILMPFFFFLVNMGPYGWKIFKMLLLLQFVSNLSENLR